MADDSIASETEDDMTGMDVALLTSSVIRYVGNYCEGLTVKLQKARHFKFKCLFF